MRVARSKGRSFLSNLLSLHVKFFGVNMDAEPIDYVAVLADLKRRRDELNAAIAAVEPLAGVTIAEADTNGTGIPKFKAKKLDADAMVAEIATDAFFGMNISQAAEKYLSIRKKPAKAPDIAAALEQG